MKNYRLIIFDLDDTLFDYAATERAAVTEACESLGVASRDDLYSKYRNANNLVRQEYRVITPVNIGCFRSARAALFLAEIDRADVIPEQFVAEYLNHSTVGVLIAGVRETLRALQGIRKVVATNGSTYPRRAKLERSEVALYFDKFFSAESLGIAKSDPAYFLKVIECCEVPKAAVLIVGNDYQLDICSAINIGVDCCWFNYRKQIPATALPSSVAVIEEFSGLLDVVRGKKT